MKKILFLLMLLPFAAGCSRTRAIEFCEGVSPEGKGVNCGGTFREGELLAVIKSAEPFGVNSITVQIEEKTKGGKEPVESFAVDVRPDKETATANLSLYSGGTYIVRAKNKDATIGEGEIVIMEK